MWDYDYDVSGLDFVGALPPAAAAAISPAVRAQAIRNVAARRLGLRPGVAMAAARAMQDEKLARASTAKALPQIFVGIDSEPTNAGGVAAAATVNVNGEPQVPMRITDLTVANTAAPFFLINSLQIARLNMLASGVPIPAEQFIANSNRPPIECPILPAGSQVTLSITNLDAAARRFNATLIGLDLTPTQARMT